MSRRSFLPPAYASETGCASPTLSRRELLRAGSLSLAAFGSAPLWQGALASFADAALRPISFRYSPQWWQTLACLPDDPDKVLIGKEGQLLYDWGARLGPHSELIDFWSPGAKSFGIVLQPDLRSGVSWKSQTLESPRVPIVRTVKEAQGVELTEQTFVVTPQGAAEEPAPQLVRLDFPGLMTHAWCSVQAPYSAVFNSAALGIDGPIHFQVAVTPGATVTVVFGLCEGRVSTAGQRVLQLSADGSDSKTVDPAKDFGLDKPGLYTLTARDTNGDGKIDIYVAVTPSSSAQQAILNALWIFDPRQQPSKPDILAGRADAAAIASFPAILQPARRAVVLMNLRNAAASTCTVQPVVRIQSVFSVHLDPSGHGVHFGNGTRLSSVTPLALRPTGQAGEFIVELAPERLAPGQAHCVALSVERHCSQEAAQLDSHSANEALEKARTWWESYALPYAAITVPDPQVQSLLDSSIRNIWQVRERKLDGPAFQVGPTYYRGLWVVDGAFLLETATLLGCAQEARHGIEHLLAQQKPDGSFEVIKHYWKENGIVLWAATRYALLTQNRSWLLAHWEALERVMSAIERLRAQTSANPRALNYQLLPGGFVDGGVDNAQAAEPEYSNLYWTLAGMKAVIGAARWLGKEAAAVAFEKQYQDLYSVFSKACARDTLMDSHGNAYVPIMMGNLEQLVPQKGQWAFCHAVYPGEIFDSDSPLVHGQLAMLHDSMREGITYDTGNISGGIWTYFASFYGHAQLWEGRGREAVRSLYAFAEHAAPTLVWREEQRPLGQLPKPNDVEGDMPHNWASAEFIRLTSHLIALDRGAELHLLEGFPREWARPRMVTRLSGMLTPFGALHLELTISPDGQQAHLVLRALTRATPAKVVLHLKGLTGDEERIELPVDQDIDRRIPLACV